MKLLTQIYKPKDFENEVIKIKAKCEPRYNYAHDKWEYRDISGNIYEIDFNNGTITIN